MSTSDHLTADITQPIAKLDVLIEDDLPALHSGCGMADRDLLVRAVNPSGR